MVFRVVLPRLARSAEAIPRVLDYARPASARSCVRNHDFYVAMAAELGEDWVRLVRELEDHSVSETWRRVEREHMEDAATEILSSVRRLSPPVRDVVCRRAVGYSWRRISAELPHRAYFSLTDDWNGALRWLVREHGDLVRRLA